MVYTNDADLGYLERYDDHSGASIVNLVSMTIDADRVA